MVIWLARSSKSLWYSKTDPYSDWAETEKDYIVHSKFVPGMQFWFILVHFKGIEFFY